MEESQPTQEIPQETQVEQAVTEKPKRGRPRKKEVKQEPVAEPVVEPVAEPVVEPVAEPVVEPEPEPTPEPLPEVVVETKTPRGKAVKRTKSVPPKARKKVDIVVESVNQGSDDQSYEEEEPQPSYIPQPSASDLLALHMAQQRTMDRRMKSEKYKRLLHGNL